MRTDPDAPAMPAGQEESQGFYGSLRPPPSAEEDRQARAWVDEYLDQRPGGAERLIPLLHWVQGKLGYLPFEIQEYVAERLGISPIQVYGVVSFYHFFTTTPRGRYQLKVCLGTACFVKQSQQLLDTLSEELGTEVGGISSDGLFNLEQVRCIGACGLAPAAMVGDHVSGNLTPAKVRNLVRRLRREAEKDEDQS